MTSAKTSFPRLFTEIDELTRSDHSFLRQEDQCLFLGEYTARKRYDHSATNQLIQNFKKPMDRRNKPDWYYKEKAIQDAARAMQEALAGTPPSGTAFVPVPPSKVKSDPAYDNRLVRMLRLVKPSIDVREIVIQRANRTAAHEINGPRNPNTLVENYVIDETVCQPSPSLILICDDLLTTGCSFRAMQTLLSHRFPEAQITGLFLARRAPEATEFPDIETDL